MAQVQHAHIMIGDQSWCQWGGCQAGRDIDQKVGQHVTCGHKTKAAALRDAALLRPHFRRGRVTVVTGDCPHG